MRMSINSDALEGWLYDVESASADEIRRRFGPQDCDGTPIDVVRQKLTIEQWRHLVGAIERLGRLASVLVDPRSDLATQRGSQRGEDDLAHGVVQALVAAVSQPWSEPPDFDRGLAIRACIGELAIAAGIQEQLDVRAGNRT